MKKAFHRTALGSMVLGTLLLIPLHGEPSERPHLLVSDSGNHRVVELDEAGRIVWQFGNGSSLPGFRSVVGPTDALRVDAAVFICGTGVPPGGSPDCPDGCPDNRVLAVGMNGAIFWQYGIGGTSGSGAGRLNRPVSARFTPDRHVLITDQGSHRVLEVDFLTHRTVRQWGTPDVPGSGPGQFRAPSSAELLANGHLLVADTGNDRVLELDGAGRVVWQYGRPGAETLLSAPGSACRLPSDTTLIADSGNSRVVEVDRSGLVVWRYDTDLRPGSVARSRPARAVRLANGNTLISDTYNHQVIEVNPALELVFSHGEVGRAGAGATGLRVPGDAKALGDFTGLTPPYAGGSR